MDSNKSLRKNMRQEMKDRKLFHLAQQYTYKYLNTVYDRNVKPTKEALENLKHFDEALPDKSSDPEAVIQQLQQYGAPGTVATLGGRYFGFVTGSVVPVGLAAKQMATYWDQVSAMHVISPIAAKLESVVEEWLLDIFGLPANVVAGFVSGSSMAGFCGMAAARYRLLKKQGWDVNEQGLMNAPKIRIVTGKEAHSTVLKAISLLGFGKQNIEFVEVDEQGRMIADAIPALDETCLVILQAGNVNSGSFDPIEAICRKANEAGAWVHIDGAFGLWVQATKKLSHLTEGMKLAQSFSVDAHKTLNAPYDSGVILCGDKEALVSALHMKGGYIVISEEHRDGMFYTPEMSRRARIVELWAIMRYLGREGIDELVVGLHERAVQFAERLRAIEGFTVMNEVVFNQVVVRCETEELTNRVLERIQELRECWVGGSYWGGHRVIRISVCSWVTTKADVERSVDSFVRALLEIQTPSL